jgi:hypothetical protein
VWEALIVRGNKPNSPLAFLADFSDGRNVVRTTFFMMELVILDLLLVCIIHLDGNRCITNVRIY